MNDKPWIDYRGQFRVNTLLTLKKYFHHKTGKQVEIHKTATYLVINYINSKNELQVEKIRLPGGVLYCLEEKDLIPVITKINANVPKINANVPKTDGHGDGEFDE